MLKNKRNQFSHILRSEIKKILRHWRIFSVILLITQISVIALVIHLHGIRSYEASPTISTFSEQELAMISPKPMQNHIVKDVFSDKLTKDLWNISKDIFLDREFGFHHYWSITTAVNDSRGSIYFELYDLINVKPNELDSRITNTILKPSIRYFHSYVVIRSYLQHLTNALSSTIQIIQTHNQKSDARDVTPSISDDDQNAICLKGCLDTQKNYKQSVLDLKKLKSKEYTLNNVILEINKLTALHEYSPKVLSLLVSQIEQNFKSFPKTMNALTQIIKKDLELIELKTNSTGFNFRDIDIRKPLYIKVIAAIVFAMLTTLILFSSYLFLKESEYE
jgi:hypothetical protein